MKVMKLFEKPGEAFNWDYDGEAATLYLSLGKPKSALGIDVGDGFIVRYDELAKEVVGLTIVGVGRRTEQHIQKQKAA